jgi:hypothetical protein
MKLGMLAFGALLAVSAPALGRSFMGMPIADPIWLVQAAGDQGREITANEGEWVTRVPLLPGALAELTEDAVAAADGALVYPKGEKLILRMIGNSPGFCTITHRKVGKTKVGLPGSSGNDVCFFDSDGDDRFDASVRIKNFSGTTIFGASIPYRNRVPIRPAAFRRLERTQTDRPFFVGVKFSGVYLGGKPHLTVYYGADGAEMPVGTSMKLARDGKIDILGASYSVLGREGHVIRLRVDRAIPAQPFQLSEGVF